MCGIVCLFDAKQKTEILRPDENQIQRRKQEVQVRREAEVTV